MAVKGLWRLFFAEEYIVDAVLNVNCKKRAMQPQEKYRTQKASSFSGIFLFTDSSDNYSARHAKRGVFNKKSGIEFGEYAIYCDDKVVALDAGFRDKERAF